MSLSSWIQYFWKLSALSDEPVQVARPVVSRFAEPEEDPVVMDVLSKAVVLDTSLGEGGKMMQKYFQEEAPKVWKGKDKKTIVLLHGERIIGASVILFSESADFQLASGPCVLSEYGSRGLGSFLLQASLQELKAAGFAEASGVCKNHSVLAKYIYPKYGGVAGTSTFVPVKG